MSCFLNPLNGLVQGIPIAPNSKNYYQLILFGLLSTDLWVHETVTSSGNNVFAKPIDAEIQDYH